MKTSPTQLLGFVVVAVLIIDVFACSDIKVFLAQCSIKDSGTSITKEQALDVQSEFLKKEGLEAIAKEAVAYFDFDLQAFDGLCEIPTNKSCKTLDCGCNAAPDDSEHIWEISLSETTPLCFPEFGCKVTRLPPEVASADPNVPAIEESVIAFCFGDKCKGFSLRSQALEETVSRECGVAPIVCVEIDLPQEPTEPPCEGEILTKCCSRPSRTCVCRSCSSRVWRPIRTNPTVFSDRNRNSCACTSTR